MSPPTEKTGSRSKKGPRLIILVRHAQSEGNKNRDIHQTVPDHRVKLTNEGWQQAYDAGHRLRELLRADDTLQFFTSPYRRTRETTEGILQTLTSDEPEPSPFKRNNIKVYEEPRLREQDFGNFQPCSAEMERMWQERADYGHFFYRIPNGESAADAYDRISGFNESLWRQFGEDDFASVCVLVTHGLMSRVFLMKWYHFSVEYFEDLRNVNHCEFLIMRKREDSGKYTLETKLRTWSELRRERAAALRLKGEEAAREAREAAAHGSGTAARDKDKEAAKLEKAAVAVAQSAIVVPQRRWGGCPNGCNHDKNFRIRSGFADLIKRDGTAVYEQGSNSGAGTTGTSTPAIVATAPVSTTTTMMTMTTTTTTAPPSAPAANRPARRFQTVGYSDDDDGGADGEGEEEEDDDDNNTRASSPIRGGGSGSGNGGGGGRAENSGPVLPQIDVSRAREEIVSSPDATPSFITPEDRQRMQQSPPGTATALAPTAVSLLAVHKAPFLHVGRDFGGTYSGHTSDADSSEDDRVRRHMARTKIGGRSNSNGDNDNDNDNDSGSGSGSGSESGREADDSHVNNGHVHACNHSALHNALHRLHDNYQSLDAATEAAVVAADTNLDMSRSATCTPARLDVRLDARLDALGRPKTAPPLPLGAVDGKMKRTRSMANRLGDAPHYSENEHDHGDDELNLGEDEMDMDDELLAAGEPADDETDVAEQEGRSVREEVY